MAKAKKDIVKVIPDEVVINKIYLIRGQKVMLDRDLAALYGVETRVFNQAVKRNIERFPEDFMFQLSAVERNMISQFVTSSTQTNDIHIDKKRKHSALPYAFTEQGVAMLSGIINSPKAIEMNIAIMRAFVEMRRMALTNKLIAEKLVKIEEKIGSHDAQLKEIYNAIENLLDEKSEQKSWEERERIGFKTKESRK